MHRELLLCSSYPFAVSLSLLFLIPSLLPVRMLSAGGQALRWRAGQCVRAVDGSQYSVWGMELHELSRFGIGVEAYFTMLVSTPSHSLPLSASLLLPLSLCLHCNRRSTYSLPICLLSSRWWILSRKPCAQSCSSTR